MPQPSISTTRAATAYLRPPLRLCLQSLLLVLLLCGCAGKELQDWHTKRLHSEFTANDADSVVTLADYQALEDELFAEMIDKVYLDSDTGNLINRYAKGSLADPTAQEINWNRSFELPAENAIGGVLLLHGLSDSPYSLRGLGQSLNAQGYHVVGMRMPGHGTTPSGILYVRWQDMAAAVDIGMGELARDLPGKPLHIVGYSTGASLALDFSLRNIEGTAKPKPASMVLISPAVGVTAAAGLAKIPRGLSKLPGLGGLGYTAVELEFDPYKYNSFTANAGDLVHKITHSVSGRLNKLSPEQLRDGMPPILAFHSTVDATVSTNAMVDRLMKRLDPERHELVIFDINRFSAVDTLLVSDPAPVTDRLVTAESLPFDLTFVGNRAEDSFEVIEYQKGAKQIQVDEGESLGLHWPDGVISLSHVALPIPADDPIYGDKAPAAGGDTIYLGQSNIRGEKNLLRIPPSFLVRLRHNPFFSYLDRRTLDWIDQANGTNEN